MPSSNWPHFSLSLLHKRAGDQRANNVQLTLHVSNPEKKKTCMDKIK